MKLRHCLIVDDSLPTVLWIKRALEKLPFFYQVSSCGTASEAIDMLNTQLFDLIFLDVELPDFSGLQVLKAAPLHLPPTILISSHSEYAIDSYEIGKAVDFLKKPFEFDRLLLAINRALSIQFTQHSTWDKEAILLKKGRLLQRFNFEDIDYIEAYGIYSKVYTSKGAEVVNENISGLEGMLDSKHFSRVHKSYIVNIDKVTKIESKHFIINHSKIPIGRSYKPQFESIFQLLDKNI